MVFRLFIRFSVSMLPLGNFTQRMSARLESIRSAARHKNSPLPFKFFFFFVFSILRPQANPLVVANLLSHNTLENGLIILISL